jgi:hypothetical protein
MTQIVWPEGEGTFLLDLLPGEWMVNPASTKHPIVGPAAITFTRHPDGGIDATLRTSGQETSS